jgi:transposase
MNKISTSTPVETPTQAILFLAFELSNKHWKLCFTVGAGQRARERTIPAGDLAQLHQKIAQAKQRFNLPASAPVLSCYEAGRDGFWLHRHLQQAQVDNLVVDSASIEVNRRRRRVKTDRLDGQKLLAMLIRYHMGERTVWRVVQVPSVAEEDDRQLHRELSALKRERTQHINRMKGLLMAQGVRLAISATFLDDLTDARQWDGTPLPGGLVARLEREFARYQVVQRQINDLETARRHLIRATDTNTPALQQVRKLQQLRGIGANSSWLFVREFFAWRQFRNRRQVGALAGLTPTPFQSGGSAREQGISKAGNKHIRAIAIEIAWGWLHFQPESALSRWYNQRFGSGNSRLKRIGIVALARKLLIALWRYLEHDILPAGAVLQPTLGAAE